MNHSMKSRCPICRDAVPDVTKQWSEGVGFCCVECHGFLLLASKRLRKCGIEGVTTAPVRFLPERREP